MAKQAVSRATQQDPLDDKELQRIDAWWRACNYLSVGMIYLRDNPLLSGSALENCILGLIG